MANQAFALSPISARASLPSEEDYEAIREAFRETARGRWFLDEYARRNRNADTRMVLDAVARIEETLAAQKQQQPPVVDLLPAALTSIRSAVERAQGAASNALDGLRLEENLAPIRKGTRIIKEISWRWREIGADGRICDLIDAQVAAIDSACAQLAETDPRIALRAAFEIIRSEIEAFRNNGEAQPAAAAPLRTAIPLQITEPRASVAPAPAAVVMERAGPAAAREDVFPGEVETAFNEPELPIEAAVAEEETPALSQEEADAQDEAVLEMVAAEMAASDPDDAEGVADRPEAAEAEPVHVTTPPIVEPMASFVREVRQAAPVAARAPVPQPTLAPAVAPEPEVAPSLGSTLIASGILRRPSIPASDPLAPIRRMTQAEKIAFFS